MRERRPGAGLAVLFTAGVALAEARRRAGACIAGPPRS